MTTTYGTLALAPGFPVQVEVVRRGASSPGSSGFVVGRQLRSSVSRNSGQASTRTWELEYRDMPASGRDDLLAAHATGLAGALPLLFTPPPPDDAAAIPVRLPDAIEVEYVGSARLFRSRFQVEEVI